MRVAAVIVITSSGKSTRGPTAREFGEELTTPRPKRTACYKMLHWVSDLPERLLAS